VPAHGPIRGGRRIRNANPASDTNSTAGVTNAQQGSNVISYGASASSQINPTSGLTASIDTTQAVTIKSTINVASADEVTGEFHAASRKSDSAIADILRIAAARTFVIEPKRC